MQEVGMRKPGPEVEETVRNLEEEGWPLEELHCMQITEQAKNGIVFQNGRLGAKDVSFNTEIIQKEDILCKSASFYITALILLCKEDFVKQ